MNFSLFVLQTLSAATFLPLEGRYRAVYAWAEKTVAVHKEEGLVPSPEGSLARQIQNISLRNKGQMRYAEHGGVLGMAVVRAFLAGPRHSAPGPSEILRATLKSQEGDLEAKARAIVVLRSHFTAYGHPDDRRGEPRPTAFEAEFLLPSLSWLDGPSEFLPFSEWKEFAEKVVALATYLLDHPEPKAAEAPFVKETEAWLEERLLQLRKTDDRLDGYYFVFH